MEQVLAACWAGRLFPGGIPFPVKGQHPIYAKPTVANRYGSCSKVKKNLKTKEIPQKAHL